VISMGIVLRAIVALVLLAGSHLRPWAGWFDGS